MGVKTREQYIDSIRKQKPQDAWMRGEKVTDVADNPAFFTGINSVAGSYDIATRPEYKSWAQLQSPLINETISRWVHIPRNAEESALRADLLRTTLYDYFCCPRCIVSDTGTAMWAATWEMDQKYGTEYHKRYVEYWKHVQKTDMEIATAATDPKGDRMKRPAEQDDPDLYLHMVDKQKDGIVVRGAKHCITGILYCNDVMVIPTRDLRKGEEAYAVAFSIPVDTPGIKYIARPQGALRPPESIEHPFGRKAGHVETLVIFNDVFVPNERIFMCGEVDYAAALVINFASLHRFTKCACRSAQTELYVGAVQLMAECNGIERAPHVQDKISDIIIAAETAKACCYSSAYRGKMHPSGCYIIDMLPVNVGKYVSSHAQGEQWITMHDIAGGASVTTPTQKDWDNPELRPFIEKYYRGPSHINGETRLRALKLIEDLTSCEFAGWTMGISLNGAGNPVAEKMEIYRRFDRRRMRDIMMRHAGIKEIPAKPR